MKNHEWVDGKLLQTNKKYSHLKLKQKENDNEFTCIRILTDLLVFEIMVDL